MNIVGMVLFILSSIAIFARSQYQSYAQLQASKSALLQELAALEASIADKRAQAAAFGSLVCVVSQLEERIPVCQEMLAGIKAECLQLEKENVKLISQNAMLIDMYDTAATAWKESEL